MDLYLILGIVSYVIIVWFLLAFAAIAVWNAAKIIIRNNHLHSINNKENNRT